ncbi:unnamed protein product [Linum tenue]|uniref:Uncharacterized protein n=1 Tax=Linum tenue TaxID=586396 RepID=A0AAV0RVF9_9ROSI|nr:unnamed protein product [Linum tenue]
MGAAWRRSLVT